MESKSGKDRGTRAPLLRNDRRGHPARAVAEFSAHEPDQGALLVGGTQRRGRWTGNRVDGDSRQQSQSDGEIYAAPVRPGDRLDWRSGNVCGDCGNVRQHVALGTSTTPFPTQKLLPFCCPSYLQQQHHTPTRLTLL